MDAMTRGQSGALRIVRAEPKHIPLILELIRKLAEYERLSHEVVVDEDGLHEGLFGGHSAAEAVLAYVDDQPAGYAVFFQNFSTFSGRTGMYLEDIFIEPAYRGQGIGKAFLAYLARIAKERGWGRLSWAVLDWNEPAIRFYRGLGAVPLGDWRIFELAGAAFDDLARPL